MTLYYVEDQDGAWQWVEAATPEAAAEQVAGDAYTVHHTDTMERGYPIDRYVVRTIVGHGVEGTEVGRLDVTAERHLAGVEQ